MKQYIKQQWKPALLALFFMFLTLGFLFAGVGCSTVSGLAQDLGAASEGLRKAMTQEDQP